jgi:hypothetical protein
MIVCQNCGNEGDQKYCPGCGQVLLAERVSMHYLFHEVINTFWHLEKGFLYTLKELAIRPGTMQRKYLSGIRLRYQSRFHCLPFQEPSVLLLYFSFTELLQTSRTSFLQALFFYGTSGHTSLFCICHIYTF